MTYFHFTFSQFFLYGISTFILYYLYVEKMLQSVFFWDELEAFSCTKILFLNNNNNNNIVYFHYIFTYHANVFKTQYCSKKTQTWNYKKLINFVYTLDTHIFEIDNGHRPNNFFDLVPTYLKTIPVNPSTGKEIPFSLILSRQTFTVILSNRIAPSTDSSASKECGIVRIPVGSLFWE